MARRKEELGLEVYVFDKEFLRPSNRLVHESYSATGPTDFWEITEIKHCDCYGNLMRGVQSPCVRNWTDRVAMRRWSDKVDGFVEHEVCADYIRKDCSWRGIVGAKRVPW